MRWDTATYNIYKYIAVFVQWQLLKKYVTGDESIEGWGEAKMKTIKTFVRTKSGRLIEKVIMISEEDYNKMIKEGQRLSI